MRKSIKTPSSAQQLDNSFNLLKSNNNIKKLTNEEALALMLSTDLSQRSYKNIRKISKSKNADIFPPYDEVLIVKKSCCPKNIWIEEAKAEVDLEELLHHTFNSIIKLDFVVEKIKHLMVFNSSTISNNLNGVLLVKWGFDGATGQSEYKQRWSENNLTVPEKNLLATTLVPLGIFK